MQVQKKYEEDTRPGPLEGIKVVEYGVFHAGPGAGAILGDLGAEVVKIEEASGDPMRKWSRTGMVVFGLPNGKSAMFEVSNRNKKGICLDIKTEKGREVFNRLINWADVFVTNLRPSTKEELEIDYKSLVKVNPLIIHANVSGYGPNGPLSNFGAFDPLGQARSGMAYLAGNDYPTPLHIGILDQSTAITASHAIITALLVRERKGIGQEVQISLYSTAMWLMYCNFMVKSMAGVDPNFRWDRSFNSPLRNAFKCGDDKWIIGTNHPEDRWWPVLCKATGQESLIKDPRFIDQDSRFNNCPELVAIFDDVFLTKTRDEWMDNFLEYQLMFSSVQQIDEVFTDPQALANDYITNFESPSLGKLQVPGYPVHFSANKAGMRSFAPDVGEHTDEVLKDIGYTEEEIEQLKEEKTVNRKE
jgi:crotonobetainyl-CoA:carnitine CoA-transferase CaiB-like acyl-CoA transferase